MRGRVPKSSSPFFFRFQNHFYLPLHTCSHLAKVCAIAKDLEDECERLWHYGTTSEIVRGADKVLVQVHQYIRSEQDITPVVACSMDVDFSSEGELLELVHSLGGLLVG